MSWERIFKNNLYMRSRNNNLREFRNILKIFYNKEGRGKMGEQNWIHNKRPVMLRKHIEILGIKSIIIAISVLNGWVK